jgi:hypothetical protein
MSEQDLEIRITGLTRLEALELQAGAGATAASLEEKTPDPLAHREPVSTAILLLSLAPPVIKIIAELLARRKNENKPKSITITRKYKGKTETFVIELSGKDSLGESQSKVLAELAKITEVAGKHIGAT